MNKLMLSLALCSSASAATLDYMTIDWLGNDTLSYVLKTEITLPASFPKPATTETVRFHCTQGYEVMGMEHAQRPAFLKAAGIQLTPTSFQLGSLKARCAGAKLTVTSPTLFNQWTTDESDPGRLGRYLSVYTRHPQPLAFTKNRDALILESGTREFTFSLKGGSLSVLNGPGDGAASVSQGGSPQPLWVGQGKSKALKIDLKKPFSLHMTSDGGQTWDNATLNLPGNALTRWGSKKAGGQP